MNTFGSMVKSIRETRHIRLKDLANKLGKTEGYLSQLESNNPAIQTAPNEQVGKQIIKELRVDALTRAKLLEALEHDLQHHRVKAIYPSAKLWHDMITDEHLTPAEIAKNLIGVGRSGKRRSGKSCKLGRAGCSFRFRRLSMI